MSCLQFLRLQTFTRHVKQAFSLTTASHCARFSSFRKYMVEQNDNRRSPASLVTGYTPILSSLLSSSKRAPTKFMVSPGNKNRSSDGLVRQIFSSSLWGQDLSMQAWENALSRLKGFILVRAFVQPIPTKRQSASRLVRHWIFSVGNRFKQRLTTSVRKFCGELVKRSGEHLTRAKR